MDKAVRWDLNNWLRARGHPFAPALSDGDALRLVDGLHHGGVDQWAALYFPGARCNLCGSNEHFSLKHY